MLRQEKKCKFTSFSIGRVFFFLVVCFVLNETSFPSWTWMKRKVYQGPSEVQSSDTNIFRLTVLKYTSFFGHISLIMLFPT